MILIWNCPTPSMRVLTSDLRWIPAGDLKLGDKLIGVDEEVPAGRRIRRHRESVVTNCERAQAEVFEVCFSDGSRVEVTGDHKWLISSRDRKGHKHWERVWHWKTTRELLVDDNVQQLYRPWADETTRDGGYLAGFFDGEGCLSRANGNNCRVGASQNYGRTYDYAIGLMRKFGFNFTAHQNIRATDGHVGAFYLNTQADCAAFLGRIRPQRLLAKFHPEMLGTVWAFQRPKVNRISSKGVQEVVRLSTSTHTYFLEGFVAHNCSYDRPRVEKALGVKIPRESVSDAMDSFHVVFNAFKRKLGFATSLLASSRGMKMWKHLSHIEPEYYSCADSIKLFTNHQDIQQLMREQGSHVVWDLLHTRLDPALDYMSRVGMLLDKRVHSQLSAKLGADLERITAEMNAIVPETVKSPRVWKTQKGAESGRETLIRNAEAEGLDVTRLRAAEFFPIPATTTVLECKQCGERDVTAAHTSRKFLKTAKEAQ